MSVLGAISEREGLVHYKIVNGTNNAKEFKVFVQELVQKIKGEALVYMDNYNVHHSKEVKEFFNERVKQRFFPPYSCALNPIEKLWMLVKGRWKRLMIEPLKA
jgi:transposase